MAAATEPWWESELAGCTFADARLGQRLRKLIERMGGALGASLPLACQDWANTKAAYRFFSNDRVSEEEILSGHFRSTRDRVAAAAGTILVGVAARFAQKCTLSQAANKIRGFHKRGSA